jgi:hypothetical protein
MFTYAYTITTQPGGYGYELTQDGTLYVQQPYACSGEHFATEAEAEAAAVAHIAVLTAPAPAPEDLPPPAW